MFPLHVAKMSNGYVKCRGLFSALLGVAIPVVKYVIESKTVANYIGQASTGGNCDDQFSMTMVCAISSAPFGDKGAGGSKKGIQSQP